MDVKLSVDQDALCAIGCLIDCIKRLKNVDPAYARRLTDEFNRSASLDPKIYSDCIRYAVIGDYGSPMGYYSTYYHAFVAALADRRQIVEVSPQS